MNGPYPQQTVGEIMKKWPYASHVLKRHGVEDLLWWSGTPLVEVCRQLHLELDPILRDVASEGNEPPKARSTLVVDPGSEVEAKQAAAAERAEIEAELAAEEPEPEEAPEPKPEDAIPDVAAMFRARPLQPAPTARPKRQKSPSETGQTAPAAAKKEPARPLTPEELEAKAKAEEEAKAKAEEEAKAAASLPDVAAMFRSRPAAAPPPPEEEAPPAQKGLEVPPKDSDSFLAQVMKWGQPPS